MIEQISTTDLENLINKDKDDSLIIVDVREPYEYEEGHIADSVNIPLNQLPLALESFEEDQNYYIICHLGQRSMHACNYLAANDIKTTNVIGGMEAWTGDIEIGNEY
ncbi:hypothetical protein BG261_05710 [Floricoccus tropicus]|uniref:Rhodanese domain-containing protein n=1 Tax=Floricoccus tropicus TaxID=1859473 RepID=A0A1E8GKV0_9LACT|nr:rhodanese-like domain-containing protein [Floricoccus tropicus]OFI48882.1 hypothetical protein BG261_05710 [Floricoccus tropicus]